MSPPDASDGGGTYAGGARHGARAPVRRLGRSFLSGFVDDFLYFLFREFRLPTPARSILEDARDSGNDKAVAPSRHRIATHGQLFCDLLIVAALGRLQNHLRSHSQPYRYAPSARVPLQLLPLLFC